MGALSAVHHSRSRGSRTSERRSMWWCKQKNGGSRSANIWSSETRTDSIDPRERVASGLHPPRVFSNAATRALTTHA